MPPAAQDHDLTVLDVLHTPRVSEKRGNRRGEELLALAVPSDQRALLARADEHVGFVEAHRHERIVALSSQ